MPTSHITNGILPYLPISAELHHTRVQLGAWAESIAKRVRV